MAEVAQEDGAVAIPGGVEALCGSGTEGCGRWVWWGGADCWTRWSQRSLPTRMIP